MTYHTFRRNAFAVTKNGDGWFNGRVEASAFYIAGKGIISVDENGYLYVDSTYPYWLTGGNGGKNGNGGIDTAYGERINSYGRWAYDY
jgi:hypothetical protein